MAEFSTPSWVAKIIAVLMRPAAPLVAGGLAAIGIIAWLAFGAATLSGGHGFVVFDPVRFLNAQRATASLLMRAPNADLSFALTQVASQSEQVIREEAAGAVVLVKQAVVLGEDYPDITDAVLRRFGMPTDVPTVTTGVRDSLEGIAPTNLAFTPGRYREDERLALEVKNVEAQAKEDAKSAHTKALP